MKNQKTNWMSPILRMWHSLVFSFSQIVSWKSDSWERQRSTFLQIPAGRTLIAMSDTQVQFHQDQTHFLVVHETQLSIYEASKLECVKQVWQNQTKFFISNLTLPQKGSWISKFWACHIMTFFHVLTCYKTWNNFSLNHKKPNY